MLMSANAHEVDNIDGEGSEPLSPDLHGRTVMIGVMIGYPGSKVSDIVIGSFHFTVPNADLREAAAVADDWHNLNIG